MAPFVLFCRTQIAQVGWISPLSRRTLLEIVYEQYFDLSAAFAVVAGALVVSTVALRRFSLLDNETRRLAAIAAAWMTLPTAVLVAYSAVAQPIYYPRYLCYTSPAAALLLAVCITALVGTRERVTAVRRRPGTGRHPELRVQATRPVRQGGHGLQSGRRSHQPAGGAG